jgi:hypothetical protein
VLGKSDCTENPAPRKRTTFVFGFSMFEVYPRSRTGRAERHRRGEITSAGDEIYRGPA